jgi:hypothetical protein
MRKPLKPLTAGEAKQARYWLKRLGLEVPPNLMPRKGGRPKLDQGPMFFKSLELFVRSMERARGVSRYAALWLLVDLLWPLYEAGGLYEKGKFGLSPDAIVGRWRLKLRKGGYNKCDAKTLVPREWLKRGIDPETFINFPVTKNDLCEIDPEKFTPARKLARLKRLSSPNPKGGTAFIVTETDE